LMVLGAAAVPAAGAIKRPDLIVKSAEFTSADHAFHSELDSTELRFTVVTKNVGPKTARETYTRMLFARKPTAVRGRDGPAVHVPKLAPGGSRTTKSRAYGGAAGLPFGSYYVLLCADDNNDVVERDEDNNCTYTGTRFDVIPKQWSGDVSGHHLLGYGPGPTESWTGHDKLEFNFYRGHGGIYDYLVSGVLQYTASGSDQFGCTYSGGGTYNVANHGVLALDFHHETYAGSGDGAASYTYDQSCPCPPSLGGTCTATVSSPQNVAWWVTQRQSFSFAGDEPPNLLDSHDDNSQPYDQLHWAWDITAEP